MAARSSEPATATRCRAFIGGFGVPGLRDLDFGRLFVDYIGHLQWPDGVVVEDVSHSAPLVLHRLQELRPAKVVLVGAAARAADRPGTVRRYRPDPRAEGPSAVHEALASAVGGMVDIGHTLTVVHHWGALPPDTVVIEVEPADTSLGLGFSEDMGETFESVLDMVREELGAAGPSTGEPADDEQEVPPLLGSPAGSPPGSSTPAAHAVPAPEAAPPEDDPSAELVNYGRFHQRVTSTIEALRASLAVDRPPQVEGLSVAARLRSAGGLGIGGDWYDVMPVGNGWTGVAVGDVVGRGPEAVGVMSHLRAATLAYALLGGTAPARLVGQVDRLAQAMDLGAMTTLLYLAVHAASGQVALASAGHCPPLLVAPSGSAEFFEGGRSVPLGTVDDADRPEAGLLLRPGHTLLVYTDGLVESRRQPISEGLAQLRRAAANGPRDLDSLCDHVLSACTGTSPRGDDVAVVAIRRDGTDD